ncbi:hypothetical protein CAPTEDRAFT_220811 [Capitella teleta]|uniref:Serotonin N-acetyltransferase n=1 Tax=Capitella teleta TaxID=283909 RepID=R7UAL3_CAPTE|nr:hypothetical protein CAPTEDRAFT_220811 [Capitella teleta]|eukprot:ELU00181.1 hypothetical protein CAPTEDRAFT_220811 [Capitella teleta]
MDFGPATFIKAEQVHEAHALETEAFSPDEAESLETFQRRQTEAPELFIGLYEEGTTNLIAFICSTRSAGPTWTTQSMKTHLPLGECVCIHSVVVAKQHRKKGIARKLLSFYETHLLTLNPKPSKIVFVCKENIIDFYKYLGYSYLGPSSEVYGSARWFSMEKLL